jgi:prolyl 4-hydroxylase
MVYVSDACEGGGTEFPMLDSKKDGRWCEFVDCDIGGEGVAFKPRKGAAVFWLNFDEDGRGLKETIHAGLPVTKGVKVGLNIWSWWQRGLEPQHLREEL